MTFPVSGSPQKLSAEQIEALRYARRLTHIEEQLFCHLDALQAENERMEAALREMPHINHGEIGGSDWVGNITGLRCPGCIAEAALKGAALLESSR